MDHPVHLTSAANATVKAVGHLRHQRYRQSRGLFVAEGQREVVRALDAGLRLHELFWCPQMVTGRPGLAPVISQAQVSLGQLETARCYTVAPSLMRKMAYRQVPEGILAVFEQPRWSLDELIGSGSQERVHGPDLWLVAVGTQKPGNLGSMVRSAAAAGANGVLVADGVVDVFNPNAIRASTGAVYRLPLVGAPSGEIFARLRRHGIGFVAAVPRAQTPYTRVDLTAPVALVIGPEDTGLSGVWLPSQSQATGLGLAGGRCVSIPMIGHVVDSLNASVAAAVLLFEAARQRREKSR